MIPIWERQTIFEISESSHVAEVRRFTTELAEDSGFNESQAGAVALVTTELATNLLKHARAVRSSCDRSWSAASRVWNY